MNTKIGLCAECGATVPLDRMIEKGFCSLCGLRRVVHLVNVNDLDNNTLLELEDCDPISLESMTEKSVITDKPFDLRTLPDCYLNELSKSELKELFPKPMTYDQRMALV